MHRLITLLLIPIFLLGRPMPHSHAGTGIAEPNGHNLRPHIHLHSDHHWHDHDHQSHDRSSDKAGEQEHSVDLLLVAEHDADAVYFVSETCSEWKQSGASIVQTLGVTSFNVVPARRPERECRYHQWHPPDFSGELPIYLLTASLRL